MTKKSTKAVFILIPIFGLQFLLLPIRPSKDSPLEYIYQVVSSLSTSTQGITVSFLLCFSNEKILTNLRRSFIGFKEKLEELKIEILRIDTKEQLADIFTKPLDQNTFQKMHKCIMGW